MPTNLPPHLQNVGPPPGLRAVPLRKPERVHSEDSNSRRSSVSSWASGGWTTDTSVHDVVHMFNGISFGHTKQDKEAFSSWDDFALSKADKVHQASMPSSSNLDIRAAPFIPKARRPSLPHFIDAYDPNMPPDLTPPPPIPETPTLTHKRPPMWYPYFLAGASSSDTDARERHALQLVQSVEAIWDSDNVQDLTLYFCHRAMEPSCDRNLLVLFAWKVHKIFDRIPGSDVPHLFLQHLKSTVLGHFLCRWDPTMQQESVKITSAYIKSSLSLAEFVGRLFANELLSKFTTKDALAALFRSGINSMIRLQAAELILYNLTHHFWVGYEMQIYSVAYFLYVEKENLDLENPQHKKLGTRLEELASYIQNILSSD